MGETLIVDMSEGCGVADWTLVAKHWTGELLPKVHGFIFRGTEGNIFDDRVFEYCNGVKSFGCTAWGIYGWHNPKRSASKNIAQADKLVACINTLGEIPPLGIWQDDETDYDKLTIREMRDAIWKYNDRVENGLGLESETLGKYSRKWWWYENVANPTNGWTDIPRGKPKAGYKPQGRPVWLCHPDSPPPFLQIDDWTHRYGENCDVFRQYSFKGEIAGVDASVDYNTFNGTLAEYVGYFDLTELPEEPEKTLHLAEVLVDGSSLRREPILAANTLFGKATKGTRINVTDEVVNGYRKGEMWIWDQNIRLVD